jgi:transcriptional regulator with XRE-family HTH domain
LLKTPFVVVFQYMKYEAFIAKNKLRKIRKSVGWNEGDIAYILGFTVSDRILNWEQGKALPGIVDLFRLCHIYGVTPQELYPHLEEALKKETSQRLHDLLLVKKV